jgi:uncharacterized protein HemX
MIGQIDFTAVPPPHDAIGSWWPTIGILVNVGALAIGAIWGAWLTFKTKRVEREDAARKQQTELRVEAMRLENDRQKEFQNDLMGQCKELMEENARTRESLSRAHSHLVESHAQINDQQSKNRHQAEEIIELRDEVRKLELKIERLEKHVAVLEGRNGNLPNQVDIE